MDFDYKKYSLENLENWMHDAMSAGEATPQEIYDTIVGVVKENYYTYKHQTSQAYELLALLNGNGKEFNLERHSSYYYEYDRNDPNRKNPFTPKELSYKQAVDSGYEMTGDGHWIPSQKDKVVKWKLPVEQKIEDGIDNYYVMFPDDLLEAANLKEGDHVQWVDNGDGSYTMVKVTHPLGMDGC